MSCKHNDCGWCYAKCEGDEPSAHCSKDGACLGQGFCLRYQHDGRSRTTAIASGADVTIEEGPMFNVPVPNDKHEERKQRPLYSGVLKYFPDALMEVAHCSWLGHQQHNDPNKPLHWDRDKSADELDALMRHLLEINERDSDGILHATKVAWRALAYLQKLLEK